MDNIAELTKTFFFLKQTKEDLQLQQVEIQKKIDDIEKVLLCWMENNELQSIKHPELGTLFEREDLYARIADPSVAFPSLRQRGFGDIIKETVNSRTLSALMKDFPEEIAGIEVTKLKKIGYRRANAH